MVKLVAEDIGVAEIYSPPMVPQRGKQLALSAGWSLDLVTKDSDGKAWGFFKERNANESNRKG